MLRTLTPTIGATKMSLEQAKKKPHISRKRRQTVAQERRQLEGMLVHAAYAYGKAKRDVEDAEALRGGLLRIELVAREVLLRHARTLAIFDEDLERQRQADLAAVRREVMKPEIDNSHLFKRKRS